MAIGNVENGAETPGRGRAKPRGPAKKSAATPWSYRKKASPLHRLPAGIKLAALLSLSLAAFFPSLIVLLGIGALLLSLSFVAGLGPRRLLRGSGPLFLVVLAVFAFQGIGFSPLRLNTEGLGEAAVFCVRIGAAFAAGSLLFSTTTPGEIRKSLSRAETFLRIEKLKLALSVSLMLSFLPRFFEIWEDLNLAWKSRAGGKSLARLVAIIPLALERMMEKAAETAAALEARGELL